MSKFQVFVTITFENVAIFQNPTNVGLARLLNTCVRRMFFQKIFQKVAKRAAVARFYQSKGKTSDFEVLVLE